jgi:apolipoprotein N-acyltransferase
VFHHDKASIIPAICFDAQSPELVRAGLERGGEVLVVQSNDRYSGNRRSALRPRHNVSLAVAMRVRWPR